jgi:hypothetical protein
MLRGHSLARVEGNNRLIYELYKLTEQEIAEVEKA